MYEDEAWQLHRHEIEGRLIHRCRDEWGEIWVVDHDHRRKLMFGSPFEQSCLDLTAPHRPLHEYARGILLALGFVEPLRVVMLGLGGGALIHSILHAYPSASFQVVELRSLVVDVARQYFFLPSTEAVNIDLQDARAAIRTLQSDSADLLIADLFYHSSMHPLQRQGKFFSQCHRILGPEGWLAINFDRPESIQEGDMAALQRLFPTVLIYVTEDGNHIVLAGKGEPTSDLTERPPGRLAFLEGRLGVPFLPMFRRLRCIDAMEG